MVSSWDEINPDPSQPEPLACLSSPIGSSSNAEQSLNDKKKNKDDEEEATLPGALLHQTDPNFDLRQEVEKKPLQIERTEQVSKLDGSDPPVISSGTLFAMLLQCYVRPESEHPRLSGVAASELEPIIHDWNMTCRDFVNQVINHGVSMEGGSGGHSSGGFSQGIGGHIPGEGTSTAHHHVSRGSSPPSPESVIDIPEEGGSGVQLHGFSRLAILGDPLFDANVQGVCALVAFKTSNDSSSLAKHMLFYLVMSVSAFAFLFALGSKLFRNSKLGAMGSVAAGLGFLMTLVFSLL